MCTDLNDTARGDDLRRLLPVLAVRVEALQERVVFYIAVRGKGLRTGPVEQG